MSDVDTALVYWMLTGWAGLLHQRLEKECFSLVLRRTGRPPGPGPQVLCDVSMNVALLPSKLCLSGSTSPGSLASLLGCGPDV